MDEGRRRIHGGRREVQQDAGGAGSSLRVLEAAVTKGEAEKAGAPLRSRCCETVAGGLEGEREPGLTGRGCVTLSERGGGGGDNGFVRYPGRVPSWVWRLLELEEDQAFLDVRELRDPSTEEIVSQV